MSMQNYEDYWRITLAYTDYNEKGFLKTLQICVDFIDEYQPIIFKKRTTYKELQSRVKKAIAINPISNRKAINQMVKLGFIEPFLQDYHNNAKDFLSAKSNRKRKTIFSKIVYSNTKFNASVTKNDNWSQINFLIKTLEEVGLLSAQDIVALMTINISEIEKGFITRNEIDNVLDSLDKSFIDRKYNQIGYLKNVLDELDEIVFVKNNGIYELYFTEDAKRIFGENLSFEVRKRDPYLHLLYKNQLLEESFTVYHEEKCMLEQLAYPVLIASHIKPFIKSDENEAYDVNNGILLSKNMDSLFDLGYISFEDNGNIIFANELSNEVKQFVSNYKLDSKFLNEKRIEYLEFHRNEVFEKKFSSS